MNFLISFSYEQWKKQNRRELPRVGEREEEHGINTLGNKNRHKYRHTGTAKNVANKGELTIYNCTILHEIYSKIQRKMVYIDKHS